MKKNQQDAALLQELRSLSDTLSPLDQQLQVPASLSADALLADKGAIQPAPPLRVERRRKNLRRLSLSMAGVFAVLIAVGVVEAVRLRPVGAAEYISAASSHQQVVDALNHSKNGPPKPLYLYAWQLVSALPPFALFSLTNSLAKGESVDFSGSNGIMEDAVGEQLRGPNEPTSPPPTDSDGASPEYSDTNVQVEGVDEADIIKTNGRYIYYIHGQVLTVLRPDASGKLEECSATYLWEQMGYAYDSGNSELYLYGDLGVILQETYPKSGGSRTVLRLYDFSDPFSPALLRTVTQTGSYLSSRLVDGYLYVVSNQYVHSQQATQRDLPTVEDSLSDAEGILPPEDICIAPSPKCSMVVLTGMDLRDPMGQVDTKAVVGGGNNLYSDRDTMYVCSARFAEEEQMAKTDIIQIALSEGTLTPQSCGTVDGTVLNQFSMDEREGFFRIATTSDRPLTGRSNNLYILNDKMETVGKLEGLAPDESIKSARFDGTFCYLVTYRETDPLFAIDCSDPARPTVLGELKIPGYSTYLHKYDQTHLVGLGYDTYTNPQGLEITNGLKLSMFDVSDPENLRELFVWKTSGFDSEAVYNHKAFLFDRERDLIAFPLDGGYVIIGTDLEGGKFILRAEILPGNDRIQRGLFIDDSLYLFSPMEAISFSLTDMEVIDRLELSTPLARE
ncbi:MAG: hypothetical protein E7486_03190 [Ruminococcaceae bacterium]|nr:hypothetical protein [Oscillospiraceae bacterium]